MNFKTTLFLFALLVIVGGGLTIILLQNPTAFQTQPKGAEIDSGTLLFKAGTFPADNATWITLERKDGTRNLLRQGKDWFQTAPARWPLNEWTISQTLLANIEDLRYSRMLKPGEEGLKLSDLQLDPPQATVKVMFDQAGKTSQHTIRLGTVTAGKQFVLIDEDPNIYLVPNTLDDPVVKSKFDAWHKTTLTPPQTGLVDWIKLTQDGKTVELNKSDGQWAFGAGQSGRAGDKPVKELLNSLDALTITEFVTQEATEKELQAFGLDKPSVELAIRAQPAPEISATTQPSATQPAKPPQMATLRFGGPADMVKASYFASWSSDSTSGSIIMKISAVQRDRIARKTDDLRDSRITILAGDQVREVSVERTGQPVMKLQKAPEGWMFADPQPGYSADVAVVNELINKITAATADSYVVDAKPTSAPSGTIQLWALGKADPDVLRVYSWPEATASSGPPATTPASGAQTNWLVIRNNETTGYVLAAKFVNLAVTPLDLRQRTVGDFHEDKITRIAITRPGDSPVILERAVSLAATQPDTQPATQGSGAPPAPAGPLATPWQLSGSTGFERQSVEALIRELTPLRVVKWLEPATPQAAKPLEVRIESADGKGLILFIDPVTHQAMAQGVSAQFEVSSTLVQALQTEFRPRGVIAIPTAQFKEIVIKKGGVTMTVYKDSGGTYQSTTGGQKVNQSHAGAMFDTLAGLRVEKFIDGGPSPIVTTTLQIDIEATDGRKVTLQMPAVPNDPATGVVSGSAPGSGAGEMSTKTFKLDAATYQKLSADLLAPEEAAPPPTQNPGGFQMPSGIPGMPF